MQNAGHLGYQSRCLPLRLVRGKRVNAKGKSEETGSAPGLPGHEHDRARWGWLPSGAGAPQPMVAAGVILIPEPPCSASPTGRQVSLAQ